MKNIKKFMKFTAYYLGRFLPDKIYLDIRFFFVFHKFIHWKNPQSFSEKIQWLKIYGYKKKYSIMADKYKVKKYVSDLIGAEYIIPTLGVWDNYEKIDFTKLPEQFALKCTHDSGSILVCRDKKKFDFNLAEAHLKRCLKRSGYLPGRERTYKYIKPRIIAEKYLVDESGDELKDYKFFCFNGKVKCLKIDFDRFTCHRANYYDSEMNLLPFGEEKYPPCYSKNIQKPANFEKMVNLAEKLSSGIPFLRVDFYNIKGKIYFGELTFYPACGFERFVPEKWDNILGSWLYLNEEDK